MAKIGARLEALIGTESFLEFERQTIEAHQREAEKRIIATLQAVLRDPEFLYFLNCMLSNVLAALLAGESFTFA